MGCDNDVVSLNTPQRGSDGLSSYIYIAYADNVVAGTPDIITNISYNTPTSGSQWFAFITSSTPITTFTSSLFENKWVKFKGADGSGAAGITIKNNNSVIKANVNILDFVGAGLTGVTVTDPGSTEADVNIVTAGLITKTRSQMLLDMTNNVVVPGANYLITNAGQSGIILKGITTKLVSSQGHYIGYYPDYQNTTGDFINIWNSGDSSVTINKLYAYQDIMYSSITGVTGSPPVIDAVNWLPISRTDERYKKTILSVVYDITTDTVTQASDSRGNLVIGSGFFGFRWGDDNCNSNFVAGIFSGTTFNLLRGVIQANVFCNSVVTSTTNTVNLNNNNINKSLISLTGSNIEIANSNIFCDQLNINNTTGTFILNKCVVENGLVSIFGSGNTIETTRFFNNSNSINVNTSTYSLFNSEIGISITLTNNTSNLIVNNTNSNHAVTLDLDTLMSGNILTLPSNAEGAGKWILTASSTKTIDTIISNFIEYPIEISCANTKSAIISPTAVAGTLVNKIVSDGGNLTLIGRSEASDIYVIKQSKALGGSDIVWKKLYATKYI
jgi:hypothetical protein